MGQNAKPRRVKPEAMGRGNSQNGMATCLLLLVAGRSAPSAAGACDTDAPGAAGAGAARWDKAFSASRTHSGVDFGDPADRAGTGGKSPAGSGEYAGCCLGSGGGRWGVDRQGRVLIGTRERCKRGRRYGRMEGGVTKRLWRLIGGIRWLRGWRTGCGSGGTGEWWRQGSRAQRGQGSAWTSPRAPAAPGCRTA